MVYSDSPVRDDLGRPPATWERVVAIYQRRSKGLASLLHIRPVGEDRAEIVTPFLDPENARISIFVVPNESGFVLCDGGLALRIVGIAARPDGMEILASVVRDYGLGRSGNHVTLVATASDLPSRQFSFCSALINLMDRLRAER